ncbi:MAG: PASTA domain-containing protein [Myxococcales bacterium]|nr:PASTA domain-containing protein [Myxococcales bacterium]
MSLTITARIVDREDKPRAQLDAQVRLFTVDGAPKVLVAGATAEDGTLVLLSRLSIVDYQPRLQLLLRVADTFVVASERPLEFKAAACDFGQLVYPPGDRVDGEALDARPSAPSDDDALAALTVQLTKARDEALAAQALQLGKAKDEALAAQALQLGKARDEALAALAAQLGAARDAERAAEQQQHAQALADKDGELAQLQQQLAAAQAVAPPEATIADLAQTTASQLQRVQRRLRDDQAGLQLGKVSLSLRVLPGSDSERVALPQSRHIEKIGGGALGTLDLAFVPETPPSQPRPGLVAPRLLGYTEALARRKLAERGLGVEIVHQLVTDAGQHGRVVLQRPKPEAAVTAGSVVLIAIGRQDEHDPRPS